MSGKDRAYVQTRDGQVVEVRPSEVKTKLESGDYLPATAADKAEADKREASSTIGAKAKTFAESAAAGAIDAATAPIVAPVRLGAAALGYKDPFENITGRKTVENAASIFGELKNRFDGTNQTGEAYGNEYGENARERAERNPGTAMAGQLGGALLAGGGLAGGAKSAGTAVAEGLGGGLLGRGAGALTTGAIEGSAYGSAQAGEEAYLKNIPLSGEKLVASMGLGAILGGAVSLGAEGLGALVRRGSRGATPLDSPRLPDNGLGELDAATEATPGADPDAAAAEPSRLSGAVREFADERTNKALGATQATLKRLGRDYGSAAETGTNVARAVRGAVLDDGTRVFQPLQSPVELAERTAQAVEEAGAKLGAFREQADKVFEAHPEIVPDVGALADRIEKEVVAPLDLHPSTAERGKAGSIRQWVNDIRATAPPGVGDSAPFTAKVSDLTKIRQALDSEIYQVKRGVNVSQQGAPPNLQDLQRVRMMLEEQIEASTDKAAVFFDKPQATAYKELKTQYRNLKLASEIAGEGAMREVGNRWASASDYGAGIAGAAMGGGPVGAALTGIAHKAVREHSSAILAVLADRLASTLDGKIDRGLGGFFREAAERANVGSIGGAAGAVARAVPLRRAITPAAVTAFQGRHADLQTAYRGRVDELLAANRDEGSGTRASVRTAMGGAHELMPQLTQAATVTATNGAQYLAAQIPGGTRAPTVFQPSRRTSPSDLEIRRFAQQWAAVANPLSVLDDLRRGQVTHAQIDAVRAVYPQLYAQIQTSTLERIRDMDAAGKRLPFEDRLQLDLFLDLGGAGEPTLAGKFVDRIAGLQAAKQQQQRSRPTAGSAGLAKLSQSMSPGSDALAQPG